MRVLLAGGLRQRGDHSMLGFVDRLAPALQECGVEVEVTGGTPIGWARSIRSARVRKYLNYLELYIRYPRRLRRMARNFDVVHVSDQGCAHLLQRLPVPAVVTVHDLLAVRAALGELDYWRVGPSGQSQQKIIRDSLPMARLAACVSTKTKDDLARIIPGLQAEVVFNSLFSNYQSFASETRAPFFHCIGGNQPYKNRTGIVQVAAKVLSQDNFQKHRFKILGKAPDEKLRMAVVMSGLENRFDFVIDPSDQEVGEVFGTSQGLFFLSRDEGFGLPILESQSAGCWVVTSDKEPMREVGGRGAIYVGEDPASEICAAYATRLDQVTLGRQNLARFSVESMAQQYGSIYEVAIS